MLKISVMPTLNSSRLADTPQLHVHLLDADKRLQGFAIVELLIVIVVIATLAAISIVAYSGI